MNYFEWLESRLQHPRPEGIELRHENKSMFDFQKLLTEWSLLQGRSAVFADCGLGKTLIQLAWAQNVTRQTSKPVLILTPLAVGHQTVAEGKKFGIDCARSSDGTITNDITIANYERIHYFSPDDYSGVVCDESSILKNFAGARRAAITEFLRKIPFRLLCTATPSPNDYIEIGTSSEALGELGHMDMLGMFFKNDENSLHPMWHKSKWRFKKHAELPFWQWMCSWARAVRRPSDIGFDDDGFVLPELIERETVIKANTPREGMLFDVPARDLNEQREERRRTIGQRCEAAAALVNRTSEPAVMWCHLNKEGDTLTEMVPDAEQVSGSDSEEKKESIFIAFTRGDLRVLVTKPKIGGFGMNWQHCAHQTFFPSHSYEQYYQAVRRCWRFGQKNNVTIDIIASEGEAAVMRNLKRKNKAAEKMFDSLVASIHSAMEVHSDNGFNRMTEVPQWL
jgi:hypothetical protein